MGNYALKWWEIYYLKLNRMFLVVLHLAVNTGNQSAVLQRNSIY